MTGPTPLPTVRFASARTDAHFAQILALQARNHADVLGAEAQARSGFVFARHSEALLRRMAAALPQAIALHGDDVIGYCLAMPRTFGDALPELVPMFEQFERCTFRGRALRDWAFYVGGQVCVADGWRGQGLMGRLYGQIAAECPAYALCVTEIAVRNAVSLRAHRHIGFEEIARYRDAKEDWVVVAQDLAAAGPR